MGDRSQNTGQGTLGHPAILYAGGDRSGIFLCEENFHPGFGSQATQPGEDREGEKPQ